ncbi:MAG: DUF1847 domain-containing protein [Desulfomonilia bacterium]
MTREDTIPGTICTRCSGKDCYPLIGTDDPLPPLDDAPAFCPMRRFPEIMDRVREEYTKPAIREFARLASIQEAQCYEIGPEGIRTKIPRLEETIEFAWKCGYTRIGIAFCVGLKEEARMVESIFEKKGFEVISVNCKIGRVPKETIGLQGHEKIMGPALMEPMCNPIAQAEILNTEGVDLAVLLGLCVGHDTLFFRYCRVPCTVLAVKDRVFGHNPLAALYLSKSPYYGRVNVPSNRKGSAEKIRLPDEG